MLSLFTKRGGSTPPPPTPDAAGISLDPTGLTVVTGLNVQAAVAQLDTWAKNLAPSGIELYYGEITSDETTVATVGAPEPMTAADLTFTLAAQTRPVYAILQCGVASNSAAGPGAALHIGNGSTGGAYATRSTGQPGTANNTTPLIAFKRFPAGFTGTIRAYKSRIGASGTATLFGTLHAISLRIVTA